MEITQYRDYRAFLKDSLEKRIAANPRYSLRAFARDLRIAPQVLSYVILGKRGISQEVAADIAERLELDPQESSYFLDLVAYVHARSPSARKIAEYRIQNFQPSDSSKFKSLEIEAFKVISEWHHYAILELTESTGFKEDPKWIASRLGITSHEVNQALSRLKKLELLETDARGKLRRTDVNISASFGIPSSAIRKFSRQMLTKAIESLEEQSIEERDITTITMAIDPALLPQAQEMIKQFRRKLCRFLEQGERSEVYTFIPALFRVTKPRSITKSQETSK